VLSLFSAFTTPQKFAGRFSDGRLSSSTKSEDLTCTSANIVMRGPAKPSGSKHYLIRSEIRVEQHEAHDNAEDERRVENGYSSADLVVGQGNQSEITSPEAGSDPLAKWSSIRRYRHLLQVDGYCRRARCLLEVKFLSRSGHSDAVYPTNSRKPWQQRRLHGARVVRW